ncbi:AIR12 protein [Spatholobus suberectus]|nr:AIR12 protein [Spatholobus suberectus]
MASPHPPFITTAVSLFIIFLSLSLTPSHSALTCNSPKLPANRTYANCTALPTLGAILHYTYNATNRSLAVAFAAEPPSSTGWVAWALNLNGGGMIGAEALIAFPVNGALTFRRYNLTAYKGIDEVKEFTFESSDVSAEQISGATVIFAVVTIPETAGNVSHVWQVGPVVGGNPSIHATKPENLESKATLPVALTAASGGGNSSGSGNASAPASGVGERFGVGFHFGLVLALMMGLAVAI